MAIVRHIGLKSINGPVIVLDNIENAAFDELVQIEVGDKEKRQGRIVQIDGKRVIIQVFEGTNNLSLENSLCVFLSAKIKLFESNSVSLGVSTRETSLKALSISSFFSFASSKVLKPVSCCK